MTKKKDEAVKEKVSQADLEAQAKESNSSRVSTFCPIAQCKCRVDCEYLVKATIIDGSLEEAGCLVTDALLTFIINGGRL